MIRFTSHKNTNKKRRNSNNSINSTYRMHNDEFVVLCVCTLKAIFKPLAISALPCFVYITSSFQRFLTRKLSNMRAHCDMHSRKRTRNQHALLLAFRYEAESEAQWRTVKILKKQTHHLALEQNTDTHTHTQIWALNFFSVRKKKHK